MILEFTFSFLIMMEMIFARTVLCAHFRRLLWYFSAARRTLSLTARLFSRLMGDKIDKMSLGSQQRRSWIFGRVGYPRSWVILSWVMLSHATCGMLLETSFHSWNTGRVDITLPINYSLVASKTLRLEKKRRDQQLRQLSTFARPASPPQVVTMSHLAYYQASLNLIEPYTPPNHLGYNAASAFADILQHPKACEVLLANGNSPDYWMTFPDPTDFLPKGSSRMSSNPPSHGSQLTASGFVGATRVSKTNKVSSFPILVDTGASVHISGHLSDFKGGKSGIVPLDRSKSSITGLTGECSAAGIGTIHWNLTDDDGKSRLVSGPGYYVPGATMRLLSPQTLFRQHNAGRLVLDARVLTLELPFGGTLTMNSAKFDSNLPITQGRVVVERERLAQFASIGLGLAYFGETAPTDPYHQRVTESQNQNLTAPQKELLRLHNRNAHLGMQLLQQLIRDGRITSKHPQAVSCAPPKCAACILAKMPPRHDGTTVTKKLKEAQGGLKNDHLTPGSCVAIDHYECRHLGRLPNTQGKEAAIKRYSGGAIFVDASSNWLQCYHQVKLNGSDTVRSKRSFERDAKKRGVDIQTYHADNGIFKSAEFVAQLESNDQPIDYSGVGAHHQNGMAEGAIHIVTDRARTMMVHQAIHWPEEADPAHWPFAMDYAVELYNHTPNRASKLSPEELMSRCTTPGGTLDRHRTWGCPGYVLDPALQDNKKLPKWHRRAKSAQFLGFSKDHASTVALMRNLQTGFVSPQYHVLFDEEFNTVAGGNIDMSDAIWDNLSFTYANYLDEEDPREPPIIQPHQAFVPPAAAPEGAIQHPHENAPNQGAQPHQAPVQPAPPRNNVRFAEPNDGAHDIPAAPDEDEAPEPIENPPPLLRRSSRNRKANPKYQGPEWVNMALASYKAELHSRPLMKEQDAFIANLDYSSPPKSSQGRIYAHMAELATDVDTGWTDVIHPLGFAAKLSDDDTPNYREAMNGADRDGFKLAMKEEWKQLMEMETWDIVDRTEAVQKNANIIGSTWAYKRKRFPDGSVRKLKARMCARGDQQIKDVDYFDTYAPVVSWTTVRTLLTMSCVLGLETKQVDYTLAFCQAKLDEPVYINFPQGYQVEGKVMRLKKSLYGLTQAPALFFETLTKALEARGFVPSASDACMFVHDDMICLVYVDDCLFFAKEKGDIDKMIASLKTTFDLREEDNVAGFLGIKMNYLDDGSIELRQDGLADRIINALGLDELSNPSWTPTDATPLGADKDGDPFSEEFNYRSVVGMMLYLSGNSYPEISFAVSQCARFVQHPTVKHGAALKKIGRYLLGNRGKGLIIKPTQDLTLELFADADFAGLWNHEDPLDPVSVRSRTGYIITLGGAPLLWGSRLQTETALSTMMAEYIALSNSMRELLPVMRLVDEVTVSLKVTRNEKTSVAIVWEDNEGCLILAKMKPPQLTPRSKHYAVKYHWFKEQFEPGQLALKKIPSHLQKADLGTKPFTRQKFLELRLLVCGW